MNFSDFFFAEPLERAIQKVGYTKPTPIQEQAIPALLKQKDLCGIAQTGSGKTAAFALPILQLLLQSNNQRSPKCARALVLLPTRELAIQVADCFEKYAEFTRLTIACIFGGVSDVSQKASTVRGVDVLVATPGRLLDLMAQKAISLKKLEFFVLDEADRMLDMGFIHDIRKIIALLPPVRQNLFFSATMPPNIAKLAESILRKNPVHVEVTPAGTPVERISQTIFFIDRKRKTALLKELLLTHAEMQKVLVFCRTKHGADKVEKALGKAKITCAAIHGNKSQTRRQEALGNFKCEQIRVLAATDIAARGIDVDDVTHVFNFDLPEVAETYVHRIGRTARAGKSGEAIAFCSPEEKPFLRSIEKLTGIKIQEGDSSIIERLPQIETNSNPHHQKQSLSPKKKAFSNSTSTSAAENRASSKAKSSKSVSKNTNLHATSNSAENFNPNSNSASDSVIAAANPIRFPKTGRRNRPGSRARKRLRALLAQNDKAQLYN